METQKPMNETEIAKLQSFRVLTEKQRAMVLAYLANGHDRVAATATAYRFKSPESERVASYAFFRNPKIARCLNQIFNVSAKDQFLAEIDQAIRNPGVTLAQVQALVVKGKLLGVLSADYK